MGTAPTFTPGQVVTAAQLSFLADPPRMSAKATATQSLANATFTPITLQTELEDNDAMFTAGATSLTIKTAGRYQFTYAVPFADNVTGARVACIYQNGTEAHRIMAGGASNGPHLSTGKVLRCALNDVIQLNGWQNSGGSLSTAYIASTGVIAQLDAQWIGK